MTILIFQISTGKKCVKDGERERDKKGRGKNQHLDLLGKKTCRTEHCPSPYVAFS